jgi:hypothetical protein
MKIKNQKFEFKGDSKKLIVKDEKGKEIASFFYNMRGYVPNFELSNSRKVLYHFPERAESTMIRDFKKAIKNGFVNLKTY